MEAQEIYSKQWNVSAEHFKSNDSYKWMCEKISNHKVILEIGCGTGQSTMELLRNGHKVISIEKNRYCVDVAKTQIINAGYKIGCIENMDEDFDVLIVQHELLELRNFFRECSFDIVICWNIGTYWDKDMATYYTKPLLHYGLTVEDVCKYPESSYAELIQWFSCIIAKENNVPIHIIDRSEDELLPHKDVYFSTLKNEIGFIDIEYDNLFTHTISQNGKIVTVDNKPCLFDFVNINLVSILMTP